MTIDDSLPYTHGGLKALAGDDELLVYLQRAFGDDGRLLSYRQFTELLKRAGRSDLAQPKRVAAIFARADANADGKASWEARRDTAAARCRPTVAAYRSGPGSPRETPEHTQCAGRG